jgi:two-component system response regulator DesR
VVIQVVIAEDQALVRGALAALLSLEDDIQVIATCADGLSALKEIIRLLPDVVLADIEMPGLTGIELAGALRDQGIASKVVIVTTFARAGYLSRAQSAGVSGYLLKDAPAEELADAVRKVHAGHHVIDPQLAAQAWAELDPLNDRERQILRMAGTGISSGDIAAELHLSQGTVRNYLSGAIGKLGAANRIDAHRLARQKGWL